MNNLQLMGEPVNDEMNATSILSLFDTTKSQRQSFIRGVVDSVLNGFKNPLDIQVQIKCLEQIIDGILKDEDYKKALQDEAAKYGSKPFEFHNASVQFRNAPGKWDYSKTGDSKLAEMQEQAIKLKAEIYQREKFLQTIPEGGMADPDTGNILYKAAAPATGTIVSISLK